MRFGLVITGALSLVGLALLATGHGFAAPEGRWPVVVPQVTTLAHSSESQPVVKAPTPVVQQANRASTLQQTVRPRMTVAAHPAARPHRSVPPSAAAHPAVRAPRGYAGLRPYTAETRFLSLPSFVRVRVHEETGRWISYQAAVQMLKSDSARREIEGQAY